MNVVFIIVGFKISASIREFNSGQKALIEDEADMSVGVSGIKKDIEARNKSMRNMWLIFGTISFEVTY